MKSFLIWLFGILIGGLMGYGLSFLLGINFYLLILIGAILGSSVSITMNIHREEEDDSLFDEEEESTY